MSLDERVKRLEDKVFGVNPTQPLPPTGNVDKWGNKILYKIRQGGISYAPPWNNNIPRSVRNGQADPSDNILFINGSGTILIDGKGTANTTGAAPRMYFTGQTRTGTDGTFHIKDVEVTFYAKRVRDSGTSYAGISCAARSQHHLQTLEPQANVNSLYGRLMNSGSCDIYWEQNHHDPAVRDKSLTSKTYFSAGLPKNIWIGYKFSVVNTSSSKIQANLYIDKSNEQQNWEPVFQYGITDSNIVSRLAKPGCVFIRNDSVQEFYYKKLSIIEVTPEAA